MLTAGFGLSTEVMVQNSDDGHFKRVDYFFLASRYLIIEAMICISFSAVLKNLGSPPWCLQTGSWHDTVTRVSLWLHMCHGAASVANGDFTKDFETPRLKIMWLACLFLSCTVQGVAVSIPAVPPMARLIVAGVANTAIITAHIWPNISEGRDAVQHSTRFHVEDRVLWISHAILLLHTTRGVDGMLSQGKLALILLTQAVWQIVAWLDALQSAPFRRYALVTTAMQLSHVISIYMTWQAQELGMGHASVILYLFFAASSALYEPRVNLPNFAADKSMNVWYALRLMLVPVSFLRGLPKLMSAWRCMSCAWIVQEQACPSSIEPGVCQYSTACSAVLHHTVDSECS